MLAARNYFAVWKRNELENGGEDGERDFVDDCAGYFFRVKRCEAEGSPAARTAAVDCAFFDFERVEERVDLLGHKLAVHVLYCFWWTGGT